VYMHTTDIRGTANIHCLLGFWRLVEVQKSGRTLFFALLALLGNRLGSLGWTLSIVFLCDSVWSHLQAVNLWRCDSRGQGMCVDVAACTVLKLPVLLEDPF
jgi:hypothetical protein